MKRSINLFIERVIVEGAAGEESAAPQSERFEAELRATLAARLAGGLPGGLTRSADRLQAELSGAGGGALGRALLAARRQGSSS